MTLERLIAPLDFGRAILLRRFGTTLRPLLSDRATRVSVIFGCLVLLSFATTVTMPIVVLALGPILFGVPHLLSDVRYLVVRPGFHRVRRLWFVAAPLAAVIVTSDLRFGLVAPMLAVLLVSGSAWRKGLVLVASMAALIAAFRVGRLADLVFVHAHNFLALIIWWLYRPRRAREGLPLVLFLLASVAILVGIAEPIMSATHGFASRLPFDFGATVESLATGAGPALGLRLVILYAFAQSVHYGVWLRLMPEDDRPGRAPRSFRATIRALCDDLGAPLVITVALLAMGLALWAVLDLAAARLGYLRAAQFHGHLELTALALLFVRPTAPANCPPSRESRSALVRQA